MPLETNHSKLKLTNIREQCECVSSIRIGTSPGKGRDLWQVSTDCHLATVRNKFKNKIGLIFFFYIEVAPVEGPGGGTCGRGLQSKSPSLCGKVGKITVNL